MRLESRFRAALYGVFALLFVTGAAWFVADRLKDTPDGELWQQIAASLLMIHGGAAMVTTFMRQRFLKLVHSAGGPAISSRKPLLEFSSACSGRALGSAHSGIDGIRGRCDEEADKEERCKERREEARRICRCRGRCGFRRLSKASQGKIAGVAPADLRHRKVHTRRRRASGNPEMGTAKLPHDGDQKRQHDPDRPGQIRRQPICGLFPLPDRSGREVSRAVSGTELWRQ